VIVTLKDKDDVAPFSAWLQNELDLRLEDSMGERLGTAIFIITTLFVLISFIIVSISAINIAHNFFMQVSERRREIGVLRAVGATRADVRFIILGEAALIGVTGGVIGIALAWLAATGVDFASARLLPPFPFKPETYFDFQPWILGGGLLFATLFCVLGGFLPARKASLMEPAQALAQN
jgi:ABC-type antimicrobial peptide transport system permease subunit